MKEIPVFKKGKIVGQLKVDDEDYEMMKRFNYSAVPADDGDGFKSVHITMPVARFLMSAKKGMFVDNKNRDGFDNQKKNLRVCTFSQNMANREFKKTGKGSRYRGVFRSGNRWMAHGRFNGKREYLGCWETEMEAARAYDKMAIKAFGEFATINGV